MPRNSGKPNNSQFKTAVKLYNDQMMRDDVVERGSVTKSQKGKKAHVERRVREWTMFQRRLMQFLLASGNKGKGQRRKGRSSSPAFHSKAKPTDGEGQKSSKDPGNKEESSSDERSEIPCRVKFCKNPSCKFWHLSVCQSYESEKGGVYGDKCHFRHVEAEGKPNKRSEKGGAKGPVAILKESIQLGRVSQDS